MSRPTPQEEEEWAADPHQYTGGRWKFVVLKPGQTVFFNSGTIHFIFWPRGKQTLALGGHILRWTSVERWLQVVTAQVRDPRITNEDVKRSAAKYVSVVGKLVTGRVKGDRVEDLGGEAVVKRIFIAIKVRFLNILSDMLANGS